MLLPERQTVRICLAIKKKNKTLIQIVNSIYNFCSANSGGSRRMGVERAREEAGLSFRLCQQHTGEKNKTGEGGKGRRGCVCSGCGDALWQGETEPCKNGSKRAKEMRAGEGKGPAPNLAVPRSARVGEAGPGREAEGRAAGGGSGCSFIFFSHQWRSGGDWRASEPAGDGDKVNTGLAGRGGTGTGPAI